MALSKLLMTVHLTLLTSKKTHDLVSAILQVNILINENLHNLQIYNLAPLWMYHHYCRGQYFANFYNFNNACSCCINVTWKNSLLGVHVILQTLFFLFLVSLTFLLKQLLVTKKTHPHEWEKHESKDFIIQHIINRVTNWNSNNMHQHVNNLCPKAKFLGMSNGIGTDHSTWNNK